MERGGEKPSPSVPEDRHDRPLQQSAPAELLFKIDVALDGAADPEDGLQAWNEMFDRLREGPATGRQSGILWAGVTPGERPFEGMPADDLANLVGESGGDGGDVRDYVASSDELAERFRDEPGPPPGRPA